MRLVYFIIIVVLLGGCDYFSENIEITGTAPGMDGSTISIKDKEGTIIYGENIQAGKFHIVRQLLKEPGFYTLEMSYPGTKTETKFEVYLEPGKYDILFHKEEYKYPVVTTSSKTQNELSIHQHIIDSLRIISINDSKTAAKGKDVSTENLSARGSYAVLVNDGLTKEISSDLKINALDIFVDKYPNSTIGTHVLSNQNYESDPVKYYAIFKKLSKKDQSSKEGLKIGEDLGHLINLQPGKIAPNIVGTMPDGKSFDLKKMGKKIILFEFWRASTIEAIRRHPRMGEMLSKMEGRGLGMVSISFDPDKERWLNYIDKLSWPQVSDQKGLDSPNLTNWGIKHLPMNCLIDGQGNLVEWDISYNKIPDYINNYLANH